MKERRLPSAPAHAVLVRSDPAAGARLGATPTQIVLFFDEPFVQGSEQVTVRRSSGTELPLSPPSHGRAIVRQPFPRGLHGIFVVAWRVLSDDGHLSAGTFAFSVGTSGALPPVSGSATSTPWLQVVASWLLFVGLALALGGLLSESLVLRGARPRAPVAVGIAVAALSSLVLLVLLAGARAGGGFAAGLRGEALREAYGTRPGLLTLGVVAALLVAALQLLLLAGRRRAFALVPLAVAAVFISLRGHAGTSVRWWAPVADSIHLLLVAAWVGALVHLALVLVRSVDRAAVSGIAIRTYSRLALPTVLIVGASGILNVFAEFRDVASVVHTGYGQTLIVKTALVLAAVGIAAAGRLLALPSRGVELPLLRRLTLSEAALVVAVLAAAGLLVNLSPPRTSGAPAQPGRSDAQRSAPLVLRSIPTGPFVAAREDGDLAVAFAAQPAGVGLLRLTTTVIGQNGDGVLGLELAFRLLSGQESRAAASPCGPGCYRATLPFTGMPRTGIVRLDRPGQRPSVVRFDFPSVWPPSADQLARKATRVFVRLQSVTFDERLGSSPTNVLHTRWRLEAPNRLTYAIEGGSQAILIGNRRWDRDPGRRWVESSQLPVKQPTPTWGSAPQHAALLGSGRVGGREVWRISFVKTDGPAWFTIAIDKQTLRTLDLRMTAAAHFMHHVYGGFNNLPRIHPPG